MDVNEYGVYECCGREPHAFDCDNDKCVAEVCWSLVCSKCLSEVRFCDEGSASEPCAGCNAVAGEPCRPGCLSSVTDDEGQPLADDETVEV